MGKGKMWPGRAARVTAFLAGLILALSVPAVAFAANTATFSGVTPKAGSSSSVTKPHVVVTVYDRYGVTGTHYWMKIDGVKVAVRIYRFPGTGYNKFKLGYYVPAPLSSGVHRVTVRVTDRRSRISTFSWSFTVSGDSRPPVTTSDAAGPYTSSATIHLHATDNVGVAHTYYQLDGGPTTEGTVAAASTPGLHFLFFWSVDAAGNVEAKNFVMFTINVVDLTAPVTTSDAVGTYAGSGIIHLFATDADGVTDVAATWYRLNAGSQTLYTSPISVTASGTLEFWSVDKAGNTEVHHTVSFSVVQDLLISYWHKYFNTFCNECHDPSLTVQHAKYNMTCEDCHQSTDPKVVAAIDAGSTVCEGCHAFPHQDFVVGGVAVHSVSGACFNPNCHAGNVVQIHLVDNLGTGAPGCAACHGAGVTASLDCLTCHPNAGTVHDPVLAVFTDNGHAAKLACSGCHDQVVGLKKCTDCHGPASIGNPVVVASSGAVDFSTGDTVTRSDGTTYTPTDVLSEFNNSNASRHKIEGIPGVTTSSVGMRSRFDGSQGVTLIDTNGDTVMTTWGVPKINVFWGSTDTSAPATAIKGLTPDSMIGCDDCHTGSNLAGAAGPHGSTAEWIMDPNYPAPYEMATLSHATTISAGIKIRTAASLIATATNLSSTFADGSKPGVNGVICAKCHDLFNPGTGLRAGTSNTAHGSHHYDRSDGSADCISCHIAIPHGWKRPRLLLDSSVDVAPYKSPDVRGRVVNGAFVGVGMGPISAGDDHSLDASGTVPWTEAKCTACGDEHEGEGNLSGAFSIVTTGTTVTWYATTDPSYGIAEWDVDEDPLTSTALQEGTVDLYSPTRQYQVPVLTITMPDTATHTVEVEWTGTKNAASTGTFISVDKFVLAKGTVEQSDRSFAYDGIWTTVPDVLASGATFAVTNDPGNDNAKLR
jgi:hypothetical protein